MQFVHLLAKKMWLSSRFQLISLQTDFRTAENRTIFSLTLASHALWSIRMRFIIFLTTIFLIADLIADTAISQQSRLPSAVSDSTRATPFRGMSKQEVERSFGSPGSTSQLAGEQPLSVWHYNNFSVYFQQNRVLQSVQAIQL